MKTRKPSTTSTAAQGFHLPAGVSSRKEPVPGGGTAYVFRHTTLGSLGRLVLQERAGQCHVFCEVAGEPEDPMTAQRLAILQPLSLELIQRLEAQFGGPVAAPRASSWPPPASGDPGEWVESKMMQCERCDAGVALLIFAVRATDEGGLEDYARRMYREVVRQNLPTYVIGPALGGGPLMDRPADILKIWPEREPVRRLRPDEFNPLIDVLAQAHCR